MKDFIKNKLNEAFLKESEKETIKNIISSKELEKKIEKIVLNKINKDNKELEDKVTEITKDVLAQLFKTLWTKKGVWNAAIK